MFSFNFAFFLFTVVNVQLYFDNIGSQLGIHKVIGTLNTDWMAWWDTGITGSLCGHGRWARGGEGWVGGDRHGCTGLEAASGLQLMLWVHDKQSVNLISSSIECTVCIYLYIYIYFCMFICMDHSILYRYGVIESEHASMHWFFFFRKRFYPPACVQMNVNHYWSLNLSTSHCICTRRPRLHRPVDLFIYLFITKCQLCRIHHSDCTLRKTG